MVVNAPESVALITILAGPPPDFAYILRLVAPFGTNAVVKPCVLKLAV